MAKKHILNFEKYEEPKNLCYLTLIEYKKVKYLTIIENIIDNEIQAYVLDNLVGEEIDQDWFLSIATKWFYSSSDKYPLSFEFSKLGYGDVVKKLLKTFNVNSTSRIIGKLFTYPLNDKPKIKRRRVIPIQDSIEIKFK